MAITSDDFLKALQQQVPVENIRQFVSSLAAEISDRLAEGKNLALGILLTEAGLAYKELAVDENSAQVIGVVVTKDAVVVGAGTATKDGALIVDDVITDEGETVLATAVLPGDVPEDAKPDETEKPADQPTAA
jgi:hypothetical protein